AQRGATSIPTRRSSDLDWVLSYQWQQDGVDISGQTGSTYLVAEGDETHTIDVVVTAHNDNGGTASGTSAATAAVLDKAASISGRSITDTAQLRSRVTAD